MIGSRIDLHQFLRNLEDASSEIYAARRSVAADASLATYGIGVMQLSGVLSATVALLLYALVAQAQSLGDAQRGAQVFNQCKICHSLEAGKNMLGPSLHGVIGRKAGSVPDFAYSPAMKNSNVTWNDDTLSKYLSDPKAFIPGDKMAFPGVKDPNKLGDLLAYLNQATR